MADFSILGFVAKLTEMTIATEEVSRSSLDEAARIVQKEAKDSLGEYQTDNGPFLDWAELADVTKDDRAKRGYPENEPGLVTGEMRDSIERTVETEGFGGVAHIGSDNDKLVYFELGTDVQPPRSVLGGALFRKTDEVVALIGSSVVGALVGDEVFNGAIGLIDGANHRWK